MSEAEQWLWVPGYEGSYQVSDRGRVRRHRRSWPAPLTLKTRMNRGGYLYVGLWRNGHLWTVTVHRLVLLTFRGPCPPGQQGRHLNGFRPDNRLANLCWSTVSENNLDKRRHGTAGRGGRSLPGVQNPRAKLTEADVHKIRGRYAAGGVTHHVLASEFGVHRSQIGRIISGELWRHTLPGTPTEVGATLPASAAALSSANAS